MGDNVSTPCSAPLRSNIEIMVVWYGAWKITFCIILPGVLLDNALVIHDYTGFSIYINNEKYETDVDGDDGKWHHIAGTWQSSSGDLVVYKDGEPV